MTKLEEIARSIAAEADDEFEPNRDFWMPYALAAVRALREPDNDMLHAMAKAMSPGRRPTPERVSVKQKHKIRYTAAIDVILSEAKQETAG